MEPVYLHNPTFIELDDAYRGLPKLGEIQLKSSNCELAIHELEKVGFVGIEILSDASEDMLESIRAFKGKHGPCLFTGWKAKYIGAALAALDDDNHLLFSDRYKIVCKKTSNIFSLPPYNNRIDLKNDSPEPDQNSSKSEEESGDFESDQSFLFNQLKNQSRSSENRNVYFYPGPFKLLILHDGTIIRRGKWNSIPLKMADELIQLDGLRKLIGEKKERVSYFQDEYATYGSACLLGDFKFEAIDPPDYETDFSKLSLLSDKFKARLLNVIDEHKKYFVLIGNDAQDQFGCCPSEEVTEANRLVKQGVLSAFAEPMQGDSCPVTIYAFKDEISFHENILTSKINPDFRKQVYKHLHKSTHSKWKVILKWALLAFITASLIVAMKKCDNLQHTSAEISMYEKLNPLNKKQIQLILFHNKKRCFQCLQIEEHTLGVLNEVFHNELSDEVIQFKTMTIDNPENISIVDHFGIFAATLVLMNFNESELVKSEVLMNTTGLYREEEAFKAQLKNDVEQFLIAAHE